MKKFVLISRKNLQDKTALHADDLSENLTEDKYRKRRKLTKKELFL